MTVDGVTALSDYFSEVLSSNGGSTPPTVRLVRRNDDESHPREYRGKLFPSDVQQLILSGDSPGLSLLLKLSTTRERSFLRVEATTPVSLDVCQRVVGQTQDLIAENFLPYPPPFVRLMYLATRLGGGISCAIVVNSVFDGATWRSPGVWHVGVVAVLLWLVDVVVGRPGYCTFDSIGERQRQDVELRLSTLVTSLIASQVLALALGAMRW